MATYFVIQLTRFGLDTISLTNTGTYLQVFELKLVRDNLALFLLTWTLMHEISQFAL